METALPNNSINKPLSESEQLRTENTRLRKNNLNLKLEIIKEKEKLSKIIKNIKSYK